MSIQNSQNTTISSASLNKLAQLIAARKSEAAGNTISHSNSNINTGNTNYNTTAIPAPVPTQTQTQTQMPSVPAIHSSNKQFQGVIEYNKEQQDFIDQKGSCVLIGAAGTGKTTCTKGKVLELIQSGAAGIMQIEGHRYLTSGNAGIVATSFTRRAVSNLKRALPEDLKNNCITIHKLLAYEPVRYETIDETTGMEKKTMRFEPQRNIYNPLPESIRYIIIDESSMVSVRLYQRLVAACPHNPVFIFLGDIQQLPPVFGPAILGYKLLELPVTELTQVYRQALNSPIISLATDIRSGVTAIYKEQVKRETEDGKLTIHPWKKKIHADIATLTFAKFITTALDAGGYDPEEDMILVPFNKACGTEEINKHIANHIALRNKKIVHEVIAGFNKHYFSLGDRVLYDKEDATIVSIEKNPEYTGAHPQPASATLDYWGHNWGGHTTVADENIHDIDVMLANMAISGDDEDRVRKASHKIKVRLEDSGAEITVDTASDINSMLLSYSLTVHKSQGSEWRRVFILFHQSHNTMLQRELLYTAVTRAREELYIICEPDTFERGVRSQKIKGTTLAEKAEFFKGSLKRREESLMDDF
jgi:ATP-dependent exoDNAse (exonuclease V) alpha subunit